MSEVHISLNRSFYLRSVLIAAAVACVASGSAIAQTAPRPDAPSITATVPERLSDWFADVPIASSPPW